MNTIESIRKIYIDRALAESPLVRNIEERAPARIIREYVDDPREILNRYVQGGDLVEKEDLLVYNFPGKFLSTCPGSDGMVCCQYFVINFGLGCLFDCHYCYLQSFLNNPLMTLYGNLDDLFAQVDAHTRGKIFSFASAQASTPIRWPSNRSPGCQRCSSTILRSIPMRRLN